MTGSAIFRAAGDTDVAALTALQQAAYAENRGLLGVEPLPLLADYAEVVATKECWLIENGAQLDGAIILDKAGGALLIWSVAVAPHARGAGTGGRMMRFAEEKAREKGCQALTLYTGDKLAGNIAWYQRLGYRITGVEALADRNIVHMRKPVPAQ